MSDLSIPAKPAPRYGLQSIVPEVPAALRGTTIDSEKPEEEFIKLMVAQIQNQDPEKPVDGTELISQLQTMNAAIATQRMSYLSTQNQAISTSAALLGRQVSLKDPNTGASVVGRVTTVDYTSPDPRVVVDGKAYPLNAVTRVDV